MSIEIRPACLADLPYVYKICTLTGLNGGDATSSLADPNMVGHYFAAPYLFHDIGCCFVAVQGQIPVGYILGSVSTERFTTWMEQEWLPSIRPYYPQGMALKSPLEQFLFRIIHGQAIFSSALSAYPSHLHIDLLPVAQRQGVGAKLIQVFISTLQQQGSTGLHLGVSRDNAGAIKFYQSQGFKVLIEDEGSLTLGLTW